MTPAEKKKQKRARVLRVAVPVLLAGMFASLSLLESKGVFSAVNRAKTSAAEHPAPVPVPFTGRAVLNRLENDGFSQIGSQLMRSNAEAGTLFMESEKEISSLSYTLMLLPDDAGLSGDNVTALKGADRENAGLVWRAVLEALLGGEEPTQKAIEQGEKKLERCLAAKGEKTETLSLSAGTICFEKSLENGVYTLHITAGRQ